METRMTPDPNDDDTAVGPFERPAILRRIGADDLGLEEGQRDLIVKAVRNPESTTSSIENSMETGESDLRNAILRVKLDGFSVDPDYDRRLDEGGESFMDQSIKRRAMIDCLARYPNLDDLLSAKGVSEFVKEDTGVGTAYSTYYEVQKKTPATIQRRRERLEERGEIEEVDEDDLPRFARRGGPDGDDDEWIPVRELLRDAGVTTLPDRNIDDVPTIEEAHRKRVEAGYKNAATPGDDGGGDGQSPGDMTVQPAGDPAEAPSLDDVDGDADDEPGERVERSVGNSRYSGPAEGLDTTSGRSPSYIGDFSASDSDTADGPASAAVEALRDDVGEFGEDAFKRDVSIDDRDDLEGEIRRLRAIIATQGSMLKALHEAIDGIQVDVQVNYDAPENGGDGE